jgi:dihydroorotate dehydrogenase
VTPGLNDLDASAREIEEAAGFFEAAFEAAAYRSGRAPGWYTLNLSCPNTEDDPGAHQTRARAMRLAGTLVERVTAPVWVKIGPDLGDDQLRSLVDAFTAAGVRAVVATNTLARPAPGGGESAGVSGAPLREHALRTVGALRGAIEAAGSGLDVIACGGILRGADLMSFQAAGARAAMLYSALVFRGPLAPALILREAAAGAVRA